MSGLTFAASAASGSGVDVPLVVCSAVVLAVAVGGIAFIGARWAVRRIRARRDARRLIAEMTDRKDEADG